MIINISFLILHSVKAILCNYLRFRNVTKKELAFLNNYHYERKIIIDNGILLISETAILVILKTLFWLCYGSNENISESWLFV